MLGIDLQRAQPDAGAELARRLLEAGFIVNYQPHNAAIRPFPPYVITMAESDALLTEFDSALARAAK